MVRFQSLFFIIKVLEFFRRYVPSEIQKRWSKLQSTFPAVQSKELNFWKQIYKRQMGWKFRNFGPIFCQFFETSIQHYNRNSLRKIIFPRMPLICKKFFVLEGWNFGFFGAKPNKLFKLVPKNNPREAFCWKKKQKNWQFSDVLPDFRPKLSLGVVKNALLMSKGAYLGITFFFKNLLFSKKFP